MRWRHCENYFRQTHRQTHRELVEIELKNNSSVKNPLWSESIAVGSESFMKDIQQKLAGRVKGRLVVAYKELRRLKNLKRLTVLFWLAKRVL
jgi:hypothetical protein